MDKQLIVKRLETLEAQARQLLDAIRSLRDDMPKDARGESRPRSSVTAEMIKQAELQLFKQTKKSAKKTAKKKR